MKMGEMSNEELTIKACLGLGMKIGETCLIDGAHCWLIEIGNNVHFPQAYLLAHDASTKRY